MVNVVKSPCKVVLSMCTETELEPCEGRAGVGTLVVRVMQCMKACGTKTEDTALAAHLLYMINGTKDKP